MVRTSRLPFPKKSATENGSNDDGRSRSRSPKRGGASSSSPAFPAVPAVDDPQLAWLDGFWEASWEGKVDTVTVKNGFFRRKRGSHAKQSIEITKVAGGGGDVAAFRIGRNQYTANGVRQGDREILWVNDDPTMSLLTWRRKHHREVQTYEVLEEAVAWAEASSKEEIQVLRQQVQDAERNLEETFLDLRKKLESTLKSDLAPICKICMEKPVSVVLLGCGHALCKGCSVEQCQPGKPCFFCKLPFGGKQEVFFS